ncbi:MAG: B12-binding domain-containing radical SAM protein [Roseburia sp.]|nr:B12-binding domain-containing radical SAM protein [Roseburia sp.]
MKILLAAINAKYIHSNLAVYSLKAYAKEYAEHITIGEYTINNRTDYILEQIYKQKPDVLCFSCYIWNIGYVEELIKEFHKLCPSVPIWLGGPEVSYEVEHFMENHPDVTGIMMGEGEKTFFELCSHYVTGEPELRGIDGITYRDTMTGKLYVNPFREPMDMSEIPFCYDAIDDFKNRIIYYESSRGCPFNCSYCLSSVDKKLRFRDLELVKKELAFFIEKEVPQVKFVDRTFNCNHAHAMAIWKFIKEQDKGITNFHFEISADLINEEELALISSMRPGLIQLEIGVQSTNEATITEIHRTMRLDRLKEIVKRVQTGGNIHEHLDLIAGLPYEDYETFAKSFDEIYELKPNQLQLGFLKVLKGSYMYQHADEYEMAYHSTAPYEVLKTKWLSFEDVLKIKQVEEMLEIYYNSGQFEVTMKLLDCLFESPFYMYQEFGAYYEEKGYFGMSHSRIRRCEILLEFVEACFAKKASHKKEAICAMIKEALTFDLYYRENCKSRPSWAPAISEFKQMTKQYCKNGSLSHVEPFHYRFPDKSERSVAELPERQDECIYVLFDYEHRDPLDHQAKVRVVEKTEGDSCDKENERNSGQIR